MTMFSRPTLYLRDPHGHSTENVADMVQAGYQVIAWNEHGHPRLSGEWDLIAGRCADLGVPFVPWRYCKTAAEVRDALLVATKHKSAGAILNLEREFSEGAFSAAQVADIIYAADVHDVCLSFTATPAWDVDYGALTRWPVHVGIFPQENEDSRHPRDCRALWFAEGFRRVTLMHGMHDLDPDQMPWRYKGFAAYAADDMAGNFAQWGPSVNLSPLQIPYRGPGYVGQVKSPAWKALKIALHNAGYGSFSTPDFFFNRALEHALKRMQIEHGVMPTGKYGLGSHEVLRVLPGVWDGYAMTGEAWRLMDAAPDLRPVRRAAA